MSNSQDEFSDPIEKFVQVQNSPQNIPEQFTQQQAQMQQQQQAQLQSPQQHQQQAQLQSQQQHHQQRSQQQANYNEMMQKEMMQNHLNNQQIINPQSGYYQENLKFEKKELFLSKLKTFTTTATLKEILIIAILFIIFTNTLFKNIIGNSIPFINVDSDGSFNTLGLLFMSIIFGVIFVLIKLLIN